MKTLLENIRCIISCDDADAVYENAGLLLEDGEILSVGTGPFEADARIDCTGMFLYPGLINTHHHLYQYFTRNLPFVQGLPLFPWLTALYEVWARLDEETVRLSSLAGMGELLKYGCTTCFDHHYVFPKAAGSRLIDAQFASADALGIRFAASRGSMDLSKKDGGLPPDSVVQTVDEILSDSQRLIETYMDGRAHPMRQVLLAPCSPFSASGTLLSESALLARAYGVRLHTHLAETRDEERYTLERFSMRPLQYMESLRFLGADVFYAHGIHFNDEEITLLADTGTGVCHCPCSNMKLSSGVMRLPDMLSAGVTVGLGVDGSASNDSSNLLSEIRAAYLLHRLHSGDAAPSAYEILKLATRGSAKLLGRSDLGRIAPGCAADFFLIDSRKADMLAASRDPKNLFGAAGHASPADMVFVNGTLVSERGRLLRIDEDALYAQGADAVSRLLS